MAKPSPARFDKAINFDGLIELRLQIIDTDLFEDLYSGPLLSRRLKLNRTYCIIITHCSYQQRRQNVFPCLMPFREPYSIVIADRRPAT